MKKKPQISQISQMISKRMIK